ncbi:MAG: aminotransferase class I/II-fold pyridoxal phosphate-dependent enzyme, partial [Proteobacteria bacterium]|nr:aminotransferase class I/II-fold pyridoxal phosphate-dependent enzyme [Pseudomonadota bacterium]
FVFARHPGHDGALLFKGLRDRAVLVRHFSKPRTTDWLRITVGTEAEIHRLVEAATEIVKG